jgi:hypothetical protein
MLITLSVSIASTDARATCVEVACGAASFAARIARPNGRRRGAAESRSDDRASEARTRNRRESSRRYY